MIPFNSYLLRTTWRCRFPSVLLLGKLPLTLQSHRLQDKPSSTILKTLHTSRARYKIDETPAISETETETSPKYEYIEDCERLERYCPGGFYPIKLNDRLCNGRYTIIQNLGFGGSSMVWLASDREQQELVAIKIKTADSTSEEVDILEQLHGHPLIRRLLNSFFEKSPNGVHLCIVMEAASCSLTQSKSLTSHRLLDLPTARAIIADLVLTVQFLHEKGIVHGDLHCGNVFLRLPVDIRQMTDPIQLYQKFGDPILDPVIRVDRKPLPIGVPTHVVAPARLGIQSNQINTTYLPIMLSDFGSSYHPSKTRRIDAHTLRHLVPPEIFFLDTEKDNLSFPSDIWTLGCTIFEIIGSSAPFTPLGGGILQDQDATAIDVQTGAPFQDSLEDRYNWFVRAARRRSNMEVQGEEEKNAFLRMIKMMFQYVPSNRATIQDVVESEWMQKWAFTAKAGVK